MVHDIWEFLTNIASHWVALVTGGFIIAAIELWKHKAQRNVSSKSMLRFYVLFVVVSVFQAWQGQYNDAKQTGERNSEVVPPSKNLQRPFESLSEAIEKAKANENAQASTLTVTNVAGSA